jgi:hypothetical protein
METIFGSAPGVDARGDVDGGAGEPHERKAGSTSPYETRALKGRQRRRGPERWATIVTTTDGRPRGSPGNRKVEEDAGEAKRPATDDDELHTTSAKRQAHPDPQGPDNPTSAG